MFRESNPSHSLWFWFISSLRYSHCCTLVYHKSTYTGLLNNFCIFIPFPYKIGHVKTLIDRLYGTRSKTENDTTPIPVATAPRRASAIWKWRNRRKWTNCRNWRKWTNWTNWTNGRIWINWRIWIWIESELPLLTDRFLRCWLYNCTSPKRRWPCAHVWYDLLVGLSHVVAW